MTDLYLDPETLRAVANDLRTAGADLGALGQGPGLADGGELGVVMRAVLDKLMKDVAELVAGTGAAGDSVESARSRYVESDGASRDALLRP
jgi:hypothetical protein